MSIDVSMAASYKIHFNFDILPNWIIVTTQKANGYPLGY